MYEKYDVRTWVGEFRKMLRWILKFVEKLRWIKRKHACLNIITTSNSKVVSVEAVVDKSNF